MKTCAPASYTSLLVSGALLMASSLAFAENTGRAPDLTLPEKGAFSCIEQSLSLVSAAIDRQGCAATLGNYTLDGAVNYNGDGWCTIDDTTIAVVTVKDRFRGTNQTTSISSPGEIDDVYFQNLTGAFWYSRGGEIMYADAEFQLCVGANCPAGAENYAEHVIKDFFLDPVSLPARLVFDEGLEVIAKGYRPRMKYRQTSRYTPPNGGIGVITIDKVSVAPDNAQQCFLQYEADVDDFGGGIQFGGNLAVFPL